MSLSPVIFVLVLMLTTLTLAKPTVVDKPDGTAPKPPPTTHTPTSAPTDACNTGIVNSEAEAVYVVFSNHLDVGYDINGQPDYGYSAEIIGKYLNEYFPKAIDTAAQFLKDDSNFTYIWTGFPFLFDILLNCEDTIINIVPGSKSNLDCPSPEALQLIVDAIRVGPEAGITWQAFPHNAEPETYTPEFFEVALNMTHRLDDYFGRPHRITMSQRDVPGLTRAVLPLLNKHGIKAISVGENFAPRAIAVLKEDEFKKWPTKIFNWIDPQTGASAVTMLHPHGYGDIHNCDCLYVEASKTALCFGWNQDNMGPHDYYTAKTLLQKVQIEFPNAVVKTSNGFDDFVREAVLPVIDSLPQIYYEIGDSWIFGASADPIKVKAYRAAIRARKRCVEQGLWDHDAQAELNFDRHMIKIGEHTWGSSGGNCKTLPFDQMEFLASGAYPMKAGTNQTNSSEFDPYCVNTWYEQRMWVINAVNALTDGDSACSLSMVAAMHDVSPRWSEGVWPIPQHSVDGFTQVSDVNSPIMTKSGLSVVFNENGGIIDLSVANSSSSHASASNPMGEFMYQIMSGNDTRAWIEAYGAIGGAADYGNMGTNGLEAIHGTSIGATGYVAKAQVDSIWVKNRNAASTSIVVKMSMDAKGYVFGGSPMFVNTLYTFAKNAQGKFVIDIALNLLSKVPTKHKETGWLSFVPPFGSTSTLQVDKLGQWISPTEVIPINGSNMHMHGVNTGVRWMRGDDVDLLLETFDTTVVSIGEANPVPTTALNGDPLYPGQRLTPDPAGGVHFSLFNNIWNTNYPFWYPFQTEDEDINYNFRLKFGM
eukprot:m.59614 g.59614  ORF g.59614 m.59614 type:complete len:816 (-) comp22730_c0_seq1:20-2467(-)